MLARLAQALRWTRSEPFARWPLLLLAIAYVIVVPTIWDDESGYSGLIELVLYGYAAYLFPWPHGTIAFLRTHPGWASALGLAGIALAVVGFFLFDQDSILGRAIAVPGAAMATLWALATHHEVADTGAASQRAHD